MVENLVEISGRSQLYDLAESSPNALKSDESTNKNGIVNIMCLILLRFCDIIVVLSWWQMFLPADDFLCIFAHDTVKEDTYNEDLFG